MPAICVCVCHLASPRMSFVWKRLSLNNIASLLFISFQACAAAIDSTQLKHQLVPGWFHSPIWLIDRAKIYDVMV